jgi:hypothetical protein
MPLAIYVATGIALIVFGYLALFSIGFPFLLTGVLMLGWIAFRRRAEVMVPVLLWPWAFTLGYVLVAPLGCTQVATPQVRGGGGIEGPNPVQRPVLLLRRRCLLLPADLASAARRCGPGHGSCAAGASGDEGSPHPDRPSTLEIEQRPAVW